MSDLIDRQALMKEFSDFVRESNNSDFARTPTWNDAVSLLGSAPTIEERKKGKWTVGVDMPPMKHRNGKPKKFWPSIRYCSDCGHEAFDDSDWGEQLFDWCPYCGAKMER